MTEQRLECRLYSRINRHGQLQYRGEVADERGIVFSGKWTIRREAAMADADNNARRIMEQRAIRVRH